MTTESEKFFAAVMAALPDGWRVIEKHESLQGKSVAYVAPTERPGLRVRVQMEDV